MAARQRQADKYRYHSSNRQSYVYGNVVTKPVYEPKRQYEEPQRRKSTSSQVRRNRKKALHMSPGYVLFLTAAAVIALLVCIHYVQLQARITSSSQAITVMQEELAELREENNTRYNAVMNTVNLEEVRKKAVKLGMEYATAEQIVGYESPSADYVKQYESIPENGVLAQSDKGN